MSSEGWTRPGAAAGAIAIALFLIGALVIGDEPEFGAPARDVAAFFDENRDRIQRGAAIEAAWAPLFVWFLATVTSLAGRTGGAGARRAAGVAFACGSIFIALFLIDVTALAVAALRPENVAAAPELAVALRDISWLAQGMAAPLGSALLAAFAVMSLRDKVVWPAWLGWLADRRRGVVQPAHRDVVHRGRGVCGRRARRILAAGGRDHWLDRPRQRRAHALAAAGRSTAA